MTWEVMQNIFVAFGGIGLFLFGMKMMSEGLESIAGNRLRSILEKTTSNRFLGVLVGTLVTIITNSSSATTIMTVGFVNSGLMNLTQALGVIMGANVGTTLSSQIISFKIDSIAPLFIFIGIVMYMFFKKRTVKNIGHILLGFGILFFGITVMGMPIQEFASQPSFQSILTAFENPLLALGAGLIFTAVIQSSSATTGILVAMYLGGVAMPFKTAAFIILGANIGTCSDSVIASIPANRESKRAALCNVIFKVVGGVVFGSIILIFPSILTWIENTWSEGARQVAMFHSLFNICSVILFVPFINHFATLMYKLIPEKIKEDDIYSKKLIYLNENIIQTPALVVTNTQLEYCRMGKLAYDNLVLALDAFYTKDLAKAETALEREEVINYLNQQITTWLVRTRDLTLSKADTEKTGMMLRTVADIERIGDHAENIAEYVILEENQNTIFSENAIRELKVLSKASTELILLALDIVQNCDAKKIVKLNEMENEVDKLAKDAIESHIKRLKEGTCNPRACVIFSDMVIDLERSADHAYNIGNAILGEVDWHIKQSKKLKKITSFTKKETKKKVEKK